MAILSNPEFSFGECDPDAPSGEIETVKTEAKTLACTISIYVNAMLDEMLPKSAAPPLGEELKG